MQRELELILSQCRRSGSSSRHRCGPNDLLFTATDIHGTKYKAINELGSCEASIEIEFFSPVVPSEASDGAGQLGRCPHAESLDHVENELSL